MFLGQTDLEDKCISPQKLSIPTNLTAPGEAKVCRSQRIAAW